MSHQYAITKSPILTVMCKAAYKAARKLVRDFGEVEHLQVSIKEPGDFVSTADRQAEKTIYEELSNARPNYSFLMEESGAIEGKDKEFCWVVDPLDGTNNFLHGIPHFAISIALQKHNEPIAGVIYDPIRNEMFYAEKGSGAFLNNRRLRVSGRRDLMQSLLVTGLPLRHKKPWLEAIRDMEPLGSKVSGVRSFGATTLDLAYVAAGRFDAFWHRHFHLWDVAAGIILVREAGGYVSEISGGNDVLGKRTILATNEQLQGKLLELFPAGE